VWRLTDLRQYALAKALLDVSLCLIVLPVAIVAMAVIAVAILIDSGRPVLFVQERVGRGGRTFRMYKFRSLRQDYDSRKGREFMQAFVRGQIGRGRRLDGRRVFKPIDEAQITRVGRFLRQTSLDELPQIMNVLRREMSLVGPRPNVPWEVHAYRSWHYERLMALPGITGLAQVHGRSAISFDDIVRHDVEYIRHQSLRLDLRILWLTILSVLAGRGAR
jgi:lipopolysaccharide/colanic/teichoic acid biosynthesis glycosyltransferase